MLSQRAAAGGHRFGASSRFSLRVPSASDRSPVLFLHDPWANKFAQATLGPTPKARCAGALAPIGPEKAAAPAYRTLWLRFAFCALR